MPVRRRSAAKSRLYVFPHAGAGPAAVAPLGDLLPDVEVFALNLPGRQARRYEPPRTDLPGLARDLAAVLRDLGAEPYALLGICGGALLAHVVAGRCSPTRLFVGSFAAPDMALIPRRLHLLPSELFWATVLELGGVPAEIAAHEDLRPVFEPALRADLALGAGYRHQSEERDVPITVLFGREDDLLGRGALLGWRRATSGPVELIELPGGHWLLDEALEPLARHVGRRMLADLDQAGLDGLRRRTAGVG